MIVLVRNRIFRSPCNVYVKYARNMFSFETLPTPEKSEIDSKEYKVIRLSNGLTACLVSDTKIKSKSCESIFSASTTATDSFHSVSTVSGDEDSARIRKYPEGEQKMAACALCVGVGSFSDPKQVPGLAHFLEHMVFMGSEKYPQENEFDSFVSKHGGATNASTNCETTLFYFECLDKHLEKSLDIFSHCLISPLMKESSISKEREIVDSEFQMALPSDLYRKEQLLLSLMNPKVPINSFTWGNLETLKNPAVPDQVLHEILQNFRKRHYSSNRMTLAIQARLPLDVLERYVITYFSKVPNNKLPPDDFKQYSKICFDNPEFRKIFYIDAVRDVIQVDLTWFFPPILYLYKTKPLDYLANLIGDERKGSILSYLKKRMWALSLTAKVETMGFQNNSMYSFFVVTIILTKDGFDNLKQVVESVFNFIHLLKASGPQERIFKELLVITKTAFRFAGEQDAASLVQFLVENMQIYPPNDYLSGPQVFYDYDAKLISDMTDFLVPENMNIMVLTKSLPQNMKFDKTEPWFKTKYVSLPIDNDWMKSWNSKDLIEEFSLPVPNPFLSTDFKLLSAEYPVKFPEKIYSNELCELWFKNQTSYKIPVAFYYYYFISPLAMESPESAVLFDLYVNILMLQMMEEAYAAMVAELNFYLVSEEKGIVLKISGYNQKLPVLIEMICKYMKNFSKNLTPEFFEVIKMKQSSQYYNRFLKPPTLIRDIRLATIQEKFWTAVDRHTTIKNIDYTNMIDFSNKLFNKIYLQTLVVGNVDISTAVKSTNLIVDYLNIGELPKKEAPKNRTLNVPIGEKCCRVISFNKQDNNTIVTNYYQSGIYSNKTSAMIELLMLMMNEPLFNQLRTVDKLGYDVYCSAKDSLGILAFTITVQTQATKFDPQFIDTKIEEFLGSYLNVVEQMSQTTLERYKRDLIKIKQLKEVQLEEEVEKYWDEILTQDYYFNKIEEYVKEIEQINLSDFKQFYSDHCSKGNKSNFKKITFQVVGYNSHSPDKTEWPSIHCSTKCSKPSKCQRLKKLIEQIERSPASACYRILFLSNQTTCPSGKKCDRYYIKNFQKFKEDQEFYPHRKRKTCKF